MNDSRIIFIKNLPKQNCLLCGSFSVFHYAILCSFLMRALLFLLKQFERQVYTIEVLVIVNFYYIPYSDCHKTF